MGRADHPRHAARSGRVSPNQPRLDNPHRAVRVEDWLWEASLPAAEAEGTTRAEVMRQALRELVARHENHPN